MALRARRNIRPGRVPYRQRFLCMSPDVEGRIGYTSEFPSGDFQHTAPCQSTPETQRGRLLLGAAGAFTSENGC